MRRQSAFLSAAGVLTATMLVVSASNYLLNLILARVLTPAEFGDANLAITLVLIAALVAATVQLVAAKAVADTPEAFGVIGRKLGNVALLIGAVVTGLLIAGAWPLADYLQVSSPWVIVFTAIGLPVYFWQAVHRGLLQGELRFSRLATSYLAEAGVRMGAALALVALGMSAVGVAIGIALSFVASAVVAYDRRAHALGAPVHLPATLRATAISAAVLMVGQVVINNSDIVLAKALFEPEVAGVYASAALLGRAVFFLSWSVVHAAFPLAARSDTSAADRKRSVISAIVVVGGIGAAAVVGALLWADSVIPWLLGEEYVAAGELLPPYVMAASLFAIANLMASLDVARGRRLAALALVGSGVVQVIALLVWGQDPLAMVWVQVGVMAVAAVVVSGAWWWGEKQTLTVDIK